MREVHMTEHEDAIKAVEAGKSKADLLIQQPVRYLLRSSLAGLYLSLVVMVYWSLQHGLSNSPFGKVIASAFFGVGLSIIVFTQSELFTSNCFYLAISSLAQRTTWRQAGCVWIASWIGNLLGALALGLVFHQAGVFAALPTEHALYVGAQHKVHHSAAALFWKGVLANWIVCLAVWKALRLKEELAKIVSIIFVVFTFLYLGFEHSIANMGTFGFALLGGAALTLAEVARNLFFSTIGNLVGGAVLVGGVYGVLGGVRIGRSRAPSNAAAPDTALPNLSEGARL
jgi:nitrite transporter